MMLTRVFMMVLVMSVIVCYMFGGRRWRLPDRGKCIFGNRGQIGGYSGCLCCFLHVCAFPRDLQGREVATGVGINLSKAVLGCSTRDVQMVVGVNVLCGLAGLVSGSGGIFRGCARRVPLKLRVLCLPCCLPLRLLVLLLSI